MKSVKPYDDFLKESLKNNEESQLALLKVAFEENFDMPEVILRAIRVVAESRGMSNLAEDADLNRENLYRVLSGNTFPRIDTFFKIINALGLRLTVEPKVS